MLRFAKHEGSLLSGQPRSAAEQASRREQQGPMRHFDVAPTVLLVPCPARELTPPDIVPQKNPDVIHENRGTVAQ